MHSGYFSNKQCLGQLKDVLSFEICCGKNLEFKVPKHYSLIFLQNLQGSFEIDNRIAAIESDYNHVLQEIHETKTFT